MGLFNLFKASKFAMVGSDIKWQEIESEVFRVLDFDRSDTTIDDNYKVKSKSFFRPYGFLITEWPIIERQVKIPILHQDDFSLASSIFDDNAFFEKIKGCDILVTYRPLDPKVDKRSTWLHKLHFVITLPNTLEKYYDFRNKSLLGRDPEILFGKFNWIGELKVNINEDPQFE